MIVRLKARVLSPRFFAMRGSFDDPNRSAIRQIKIRICQKLIPLIPIRTSGVKKEGRTSPLKGVQMTLAFVSPVAALVEVLVINLSVV